jgi:hypothetical protein
MYNDIKKARKVVAFEVDVPGVPGKTSSSYIYAIPNVICVEGQVLGVGNTSPSYPVDISFASICITPTIDGIIGPGGLKALENKLELMIIPSTTEMKSPKSVKADAER